MSKSENAHNENENALQKILTAQGQIVRIRNYFLSNFLLEVEMYCN